MGLTLATLATFLSSTNLCTGLTPLAVTANVPVAVIVTTQLSRTCGVPIVTHLHGGQTDFKNDGNPEFFFGSQEKKKLPLIRGPDYNTNIYRYANNLDATSIWYHDHAL